MEDDPEKPVVDHGRPAPPAPRKLLFSPQQITLGLVVIVIFLLLCAYVLRL